MKLQGQVVLISGGASGLGAATATLFAQAGAKIVILDKDIAKAQMFAKHIDALALFCDVVNESSIQSALTIIQQNVGIPRVCINCAGIATAKRLVGKHGAMPLNDFSRTVDINLTGTFNMMRLFAELACQTSPLIETNERGVIINTASIAAFDGQIGQTAYSASKGAIVSLALPAARELAQWGIRVMTIAPGLMETPMMDQISSEAKAQLTSNIPFPKRLGQATEFAMLVQHIVENPYLNGSVIRLDGGLRMPLN